MTRFGNVCLMCGAEYPEGETCPNLSEPDHDELPVVTVECVYCGDETSLKYGGLCQSCELAEHI